MPIEEKRPFNLLRWFALLSFLSVGLITAVSSFLLSSFLTRNMLQRDAVVTMEFVQTIAQAENTRSYFETDDPGKTKTVFEAFFKQIATMTLSFSGPDTPRITSVSAEEYRVNLTTDGTYSLTATVTDTQGQTFSDTIVITVFNAIEMENLLNQKWEGMRAALSLGDIETALTYFTPHAGQKYRPVFEALRANLPVIVGTLQPIRLTDLQGNVAECFTNRVEDGALNAYFVYFILDSNGFWKLVAM